MQFRDVLFYLSDVTWLVKMLDKYVMCAVTLTDEDVCWLGFVKVSDELCVMMLTGEGVWQLGFVCAVTLTGEDVWQMALRAVIKDCWIKTKLCVQWCWLVKMSDN